MKLSEGVEWGRHCVSVLAGLPPGATLPTKALAQYHSLSETYLDMKYRKRVMGVDWHTLTQRVQTESACPKKVSCHCAAREDVSEP